MPRRLNTIIIVPHSQARFIKFSFSTRSLIAVCGVLVLAVVLSIVAIAFSKNAVDRRADVERLKTENRELAEINQKLAQMGVEAQAKLDEFEEQAGRLALAAGVETPDSVTVGSGGDHGQVGSGGPYDRLPETPDAFDRQVQWIGQQLALVEEKLAQKDDLLASIPTISPATGVLTDGYGTRADPITGRKAFHRGLDISARRGTPVYAPADGIVVFSGWNGGLGKTIRISHGFGFTTVYGHLHEIHVELGDEIHRGDKIGAIGNSGRSTASHLHYEVHEDGRSKDPLYYILDRF
jgi:murein DD-endopeptidase MepM/ murein hydrolase activator NlpD